MTTDQPGIWVSDPDGYRNKMRDLLGNREPLDVLSTSPDVYADIVAKHTLEQMRSRPFEGKWTPNEILGHLVDTEWVYGFRIRLVYSEESPPIAGMDHEGWVTAQRYNDQEPGRLVEHYHHLRACNLPLWERMTPADFERCGVHNERGPESLGTAIMMHAGHDLTHIDQITKYLAAVG